MLLSEDSVDKALTAGDSSIRKVAEIASAPALSAAALERRPSQIFFHARMDLLRLLRLDHLWRFLRRIA